MDVFSTQNHSDSALVAAAQWIEGVLLGTVGTTIAALAVGFVGLAMLQGRLVPRDGLKVVIGAFILFGAAPTANMLVEIARSDLPAEMTPLEPVTALPPPTMPNTPLPAPSPPTLAPHANAFDPNPGGTPQNR